MKISIIVAVYNEEKNIVDCLQSLTEQTENDLEIIVVDDGSKDETISKIQSKYQKFHILKQKHHGVGEARNLGAKHAKGEILVFVDSDMTFDKNFIKNLVAPIKKNVAKGTLTTAEYVANWQNVWARCWNYNWDLPDKKRIDPKNQDQAKDFRAILKSEFDKVGGFTGVGYTDTWTLSQKLRYLPKKVDNAICCHKNPSDLRKVFQHSKWVAKRLYKFGSIGIFLAIFRVSPPFSIIKGIKRSIAKKETRFLLFKIAYDVGYTIGLLEFLVGKKY